MRHFFSLSSQKPLIVFLDFDNTITDCDVLDAVIERFSINQDWVKYEEEWKAGKIGSKECLEAQLRSVRVSQRDLEAYARQIPIDPHFPKLLQIFREKEIPCQILSDSFSFMIHTILTQHGIRAVPVYANELGFKEDRLIPSFPYVSKDCTRCAHCKKTHMVGHADKARVYVGDGLSDVCPSFEADFVFAKGALMAYLEGKGEPFTAFRDLGQVVAFFECVEKNPPLDKYVAELR